MSVLIELSNQKFGKLTVIEKSQKRGTKGQVYWECICDCGNSLETRSDTLRMGRVKSCGCSRWSKGNNKKPLFEASKKSLFKSYQLNALYRNIKFELNFSDFITLCQQNCHYCGIKPSTVHFRKQLNGHFVYNGIDRKNNDDDYKLQNCLPCCKICNKAKRNMSYNDFIQWLNQIGKFRGEHNG